MIVMTVNKGMTSQAHILKHRLTMNIAKWIALAAIDKDHPLGHLFPRKFKSFAINHLSNKWLITFSRSVSPQVLSIKGKAVEVLEGDRAHITVTLEPAGVLDIYASDHVAKPE